MHEIEPMSPSQPCTAVLPAGSCCRWEVGLGCWFLFFFLSLNLWWVCVCCGFSYLSIYLFVFNRGLWNTHYLFTVISCVILINVELGYICISLLKEWTGKCCLGSVNNCALLSYWENLLLVRKAKYFHASWNGPIYWMWVLLSTFQLKQWWQNIVWRFLIVVGIHVGVYLI